MSSIALRTDRRPRRPEIIVAALSNGIEWYDLAVYGALAPVLVKVLLPDAAGGTGLVTVFAVFATSFLARPVGALVIGRRADRLGRRNTLAAMVVVMSLATAAIGLLPPWSSIGVLAPAALVLLRLIQGFSSGGEVTTSVAFIIESAPVRRWGFFGGWHTATMALGIASGTAVSALVTATLSTRELESWGWRLPFLVALPLGATGLYLRMRLRETSQFEAAGPVPRAPTLRRVWREHGPAVRSGFVLVGVLAATFNMWFVFLPAYMVAEDIHPLTLSLGGAVVGLIGTAASAPTFGLLSDRIGRRPVLLASTSLLFLLIAPLFAAAVRGSGPALVAADLVVGILLGSLVVTAHVAERFPVSLRASGIALAYGASTAFLGGTAPLIGALLTQHGLPFAIPGYLAALSAAGALATHWAPETAPHREEPADSPTPVVAPVI